jgi:hypothetical protein
VSGLSSCKAAIDKGLLVAPWSAVKLFERLNKVKIIPDGYG